MNAPYPHPDDRASRAGADDEARLPALGWVRQAQVQQELLQEVARQVQLRRRRRWLGTATVTAILFGAGWYWHNPVHNPLPPSARVATATLLRSEQQELPDGTIVDLRDGAKFAVDFSGPLRRVILHRGEAYFNVAKNPLRPFVVEAGDSRVRAVGTAFSVHFEHHQVEVVVTEGQVSVSAPSAAPASAVAPPYSAMVSAGNRCILPLAAIPDVQPLSPAELEARLSWRIPQLEFSHTPLAEVIALMNVHPARRVRLVIGDPNLSKVSLSGFLRADNDEGLISLLEAQFAVRADRVGDVIILRSKN